MTVLPLSRRALIASAAALSACAGPARPRANIVRIGMGLEPPHLDPTAGAASAIDEVTYANIFEGLTRIRADGRVAPGLAHAWEISRDRRVIHFHLNENITFHDGAPCTAADVVFSLDRARAENSLNAQRALFAPIDRVTAMDARTVRLDLSHPSADILGALAQGDAAIVSPASAETNQTHPIGTGPFKFIRWARGAMISLSRNNAYWGEPARLDGADFIIVPDAAAAFAALLAEDVDGFPDFAPELLSALRRDARFNIQIGQSQGETILAMNNARAPFTDVRVRRAICHAIDRNAVIQAASFGYGAPIGSHMAPTDPAYIDLTGLYPFDPNRARALLREAGLAQGFDARLTLPPTNYARRGGEVIASLLNDVGVRTRIENMEWAQWLDQVFTNKNFDLTIVSHVEPNDLGIYARDDYYFSYHSDAFKALMREADLAPDDAARIAALRSAQRLIADDAVNAFLFQFPKVGVWRKGLEGVWRDAPVPCNDLTGVHWSAP